jgi:hypothetical protein
MTTPHKLAQKCQRTVYKQLSGWHKRGSIGVYRRTDDFVQWLIFDPMSFGPVRPTFSIQALATQFPAEALTIGGYIQDNRGLPLYIEWDDWYSRQEELVRYMITKIEPSVFKALHESIVLEYLGNHTFEHVDELVLYGIALAATGDIDAGKHYFTQALKQYSQMDVDWAREEEQRIRSWLECSDATLLSKLREDAQAGVATLKLK